MANPQEFKAAVESRECIHGVARAVFRSSPQLSSRDASRDRAVGARRACSNFHLPNT